MKGIRMLLPAVLLLLQCGCPQNNGVRQAETPAAGKYAEWAGVLARQSDFESELARLQGLYSSEANPASANTGNASSDFKLGQRIMDDRIGIVLRDIATQAEQVLWFWEDTTGRDKSPLLTNQVENAGGMSLEYQLDNDVFLTISLRWVQDRYLEVKRTLEAGGLDMQYELGTGYTAWTLDCPALPYRLVPGGSGPFGVVPEDAAAGDWHAANYPDTLMLPGLCAYGQTEGVLLAIADEHPRRLDRSYDCSWRLVGSATQADGNAQLRLDYRMYDNTVDGWSSPILFSGLPLRDSVVVEPFTLARGNPEDTLVAGQTEEACGHMADFVRAFQARYAPAETAEPNAVLSYLNADNSAELPDEATLNEILELKTGLWNVHGILTDSCDGSGLPDGLAASPLPDSSRAMCEEFGITQWQLARPFQLPGDSPLLKQDAELRLDLAANPTADQVALSLRRPATADLLLSNLAAQPDGRALLLDLDTLAGGGQDQLRMELTCCQQAAAAALTMKLCEENALRAAPLKLAVAGLPSLALPPCADMYWLPTGGAVQDLQRDRMLGVLTERLFGVRAWPGLGIGNPAQLAYAVTDGSGGMIVQSSLLDFAGTDSLLQASDSLFRFAGSADNYQLLLCEPRYTGYSLFGESPARPQQAVLGLPSVWDGRDSLFVLSFGTGLDALIDKEQQLLNIQAGNGESILRPMPFGMYELKHPRPAEVEPGEVLVIQRQLVGGESNGRG